MLASRWVHNRKLAAAYHTRAVGAGAVDYLIAVPRVGQGLRDRGSDRRCIHGWGVPVRAF